MDPVYLSTIARFENMDEIVPAKMFGWSCFKLNGHVFMTWKEGSGMAVKLSVEDTERALSQKGISPHDPGKRGKPMKQWVALAPHALPPNSGAKQGASEDWPALAMAYAATLKPK